MVEKGWPERADEVTQERVKALGEPADVLARAKETLVYWNRWEGFLESVRNDFVLSHFWARYCFDSRRVLHPHFALQTIVAMLENAE